MTQETMTYLLLFAVALIACIMLFKIGKKLICLILLLLSIYCGTRAVIYYLAAGYEPPEIEITTEEPQEIELPEIKLELPKISYEKDPDAFGFGMDGVFD